MSKKLVYGLLIIGGFLIGLVFASQSGIKFGKCKCCACGCCASYGINFPTEVKCDCKPDHKPLPNPRPRPGIGAENPFGESN